MAIFAAFALFHPDQHALGINIADLQRDHLHGPQTGAVVNAERRLVLRPWCGLQQAPHLFGREHARQHARLVDEHETARRLRPVERHLEEEPERGRRRGASDREGVAVQLAPAPRTGLQRAEAEGRAGAELRRVDDQVRLPRQIVQACAFEKNLVNGGLQEDGPARETVKRRSDFDRLPNVSKATGAQ